MKISTLILLPLSLTLLTGCNKNKDSKKATLQYGQMISNTTEAIDYQTLSEKVDSKETFLLAVYAPGCSCWSTFQAVLADYMKENHVIVYSISYKEFHTDGGESRDNFGMKLKSGYTSFAIFKNGKVIVDVNSEKKELKEIDVFKKLMESSVILPKIFYISKDQVDSLYASEETSVLYFARSTCSDCQYFDRNLLDSYTAEKNMYILDCEKIGIRKYDEDGNLTPESAAKWAEFKENYGLASVNNPDYGYDAGYVPSLFLLKGNGDKNNPKTTFMSGSVYFNDTVEVVDGHYEVTNSYYTSERLSKLEYASDIEKNVLKGMSLDDDEVSSIEYKGETYHFWKHESAAEYHTPLAKAFLDYALPKVTHEGF